MAAFFPTSFIPPNPVFLAQPALSRQVQDLEDEIGVDLLRRSSRGVTLTAEGKLFLEEARETLRRLDEAVVKVRALACGEYGELHVGYAPSPSVEILPPALAAFQKAAPGVRVVLHDLGGDELMAGLLNGTLEIAINVEHTDDTAPGIEFETLHRYAFCVAMAPWHELAGRKSMTLQEVAAQRLAGLNRQSYTEYYRILERIFGPLQLRPNIAVECDSSTSLLTELEAGRGVAIVTEQFRHIAGKRLVFCRLSNCDAHHNVGIARATGGDVTPAGEKFCEMLREAAGRLSKPASPARRGKGHDEPPMNTHCHRWFNRFSDRRGFS